LRSPLFGVLPLTFLVQGEPHPCPYLPGRQAQEELFGTEDLHPELYHDFMDHGFRRSGNYFYRTACPSCEECRPIRIPVREFEAGRSQRRVWNKNQDVRVRVGPPRFAMEKFHLYEEYLEKQHGSSHGSVHDFRAVLYSSAVRTLEFEYTLNRRVIAVSIADISLRSLSSVYVYYDLEFADRSLGTFSALHEILFCRNSGVPYYYLGFYIAECPSMRYKTRFKPHDILDTSLRWLRAPIDARDRETYIEFSNNPEEAG
jgi:leucyl-tRNA---protein transferase